MGEPPWESSLGTLYNLLARGGMLAVGGCPTAVVAPLSTVLAWQFCDRLPCRQFTSDGSVTAGGFAMSYTW